MDFAMKFSNNPLFFEGAVMKYLVLMIIFLLTCVSVSAQNVGQWVGDNYLTDDTTAPGDGASCGKIFLDADGNILKKIPSITEIVEFPIPLANRNHAYWSYWRNGSLYTLARGSNRKAFTGHIFAKWNENDTKEGGSKDQMGGTVIDSTTEGNWHFLGVYKPDVSTALRAIPCDNDKFIALSSEYLTNNNDQNKSTFYRMSLHPSKKEIRLDDSIVLSNMGELQQYVVSPDFVDLLYLSEIVMTENHAVFINRNTGLYWIFSLEKASFVTSGMIFKKLTPEQILSGGFTNAILCVQPEKEGTVLVAAQDEAAFTTETGDALKEINKMLEENPNMSMGKAAKIFKARSEELANRNPYIIWYRLYPENGKVEKMVFPPDGGSLLRDEGKNDFFRPMPDGSVQHGTIKIKEPEKAKPEPSNRGYDQ
jgi:hypothetical protein